MNVLSANESLIFKWLILYYVTFTSIKEKKKKERERKERRRKEEGEKEREARRAQLLMQQEGKKPPLSHSHTKPYLRSCPFPSCSIQKRSFLNYSANVNILVALEKHS